MATIVLTGAGGGFGKLTALTLRQAGHTVFGTLRDIGGRNATVAAELAAAGVQLEEMDVTSDASVDAAVVRILAHTSAVDAVVNNAG